MVDNGNIQNYHMRSISISGLSKGFGGGRPKGEGEIQQGPDYYLFSLPPQEKLKSAGRKNWFCKNIITFLTINFIYESKTPPLIESSFMHFVNA